MPLKRTIATLSAISIAAGFALAQDNSLLVGNGSGVPGSVNNPISITLTNNVAAAGISMTLNYDASSLSLFSATTSARSASQNGFSYNVIEPGVVAILIYDPAGQNLQPGTGEIALLFFDVLVAAGSGQKPIMISQAAISGDSYQELQLSIDNGAFEVTQDEALAAPTNLTATKEDGAILLSWDPPSSAQLHGSTANVSGTTVERSSPKGKYRRNNTRPSLALKRSDRPPLSAQKTSQSAEEIFLDVPVTHSIGQDQILEFFVHLENTSVSNTLKIQILNSSGDPDLFIRLGAAPDLFNSDFDFESAYTLPDEDLVMVSRNSTPALQDGDWFISIIGFEAGAFTLNASLGVITEVENGTPVSRSIALDEYVEFFIDVPANATELNVTTSNSTGDPDLFVRLDEPPDLDDYIFDFSSETFSEESITVDRMTIPAIRAGRWYISVLGFDPSSFSLTSSYTTDTTGTGNRPPIFTTLGSQSTVSGSTLQFTVIASDPDGDDISLTALGLPSGATFSDNSDGTGQFSWTPAHEQVGTYNVDFTAMDNRGGSSMQRVQVSVLSSQGPLLQVYNIYRSEEPNPRRTGSIIGMVGADKTQYRDPLPVFGAYYYQITAEYDRGESQPSNQATALVTDVAKIEEPSAFPQHFALGQNYPNPFNPSTVLTFSVPVSSNVRIVIYNLMGQQVRLLADSPYPPGNYEVLWDGKNDDGRVAPVGIYVYQMQGKDFLANKKMLFLK